MGKLIFTLNAGSSSLKFALFAVKPFKKLIQGHIDGIHTSRSLLKIHIKGSEIVQKFSAKDHLHAVLKAFHTLKHFGLIKDYKDISCIGHRVVHGGEHFSKPTKITPTIIKKIRELSVLAPLHNPDALAGILAAKKITGKSPQYALFDTAFHHTIPKQAFLYGMPIELYEQFGIRKYGFHGISHKYVSRVAKKLLGKKHYESEEIISCHLGNGSSITAIKSGKSIDTSMGFSPLNGVIMGTRSGNIDPAILLYLLQKKHYSIKGLHDMLNKRSGLKGIAHESDVRILHKKAMEKDKEAILALDILSYQIAKFIGSYAAALHGLDAIVFTAGIGENAYYLRRKICSYLAFLGVSLDAHNNRKNDLFISKPKSKVKVLVIPTDEQVAIAKEIIGENKW